MEKNNIENRRLNPRELLNTEVEFIVSEDIIKAQSVNISETGIRLNTEKPLNIEMRINFRGEEKEYKAKLCWAKQKPEGGFTYGFEFTDE